MKAHLLSSCLTLGVASLLTPAAAAQFPVYVLSGNSNGDAFGAGVAGVGDLNADGFDDFAVGAPNDAPGGTTVGSATTYCGCDAAIRYHQVGVNPNEQYGGTVAGGGDVNNDGFDDFAISAPFFQGTWPIQGRLEVRSGLDGSVIWAKEGINSFSLFGDSVVLEADVNNDNFDDFLVAAPSDDGTAADSGIVYVYSGMTGALLYERSGDNLSDQLGSSLAYAGDVNNDGRDDWIAGAPSVDVPANNAGHARVFSGINGSVLYAINGAGADHNFGSSVAWAGDLDSDGFDDFAVGARRDGAGGANAGSVVIYSGQNGTVLRRYDGAPGAFFGIATANAGDYDGDGMLDLVIGAPYEGSAGTVRVYSGADGSVLGLVQGTSARIGMDLDGGFDVNNDGRAEIIVGAPTAQGGGEATVYSIDVTMVFQNDTILYGKLNQRTLDPTVIPGRPANLGSYACGPVALATSLAYLQRAFAETFAGCLIPEITSNGIIDADEMNAVAVWLSQTEFMRLRGGSALPGVDYDPDQHGFPQSAATPGAWGGGVRWDQFARGKEKWIEDTVYACPGRTNYYGRYQPQRGEPLLDFPIWVFVEGLLPIDPREIAAFVRDGCDVEVGFRWQKRINRTWSDQLGGHSLTVYGFEFLDENENGQWDGEPWSEGEPVVSLRAIDPWGPPPGSAPPREDAPLICASVNVVSDSPDYLTITYAGGAIESTLQGLVRGRMKFWAAECARTGDVYCPGDGNGRACPCGNPGGPGQGCANSTGSGASLQGTGVPSVSRDTVRLVVSNSPASQPGLFFQGDNAINGGNGVQFGDGLRCAGGSVIRLEIVTADGAGSASSTVPIAATGGVSSGDTKRYQWWYRDPMGSPCGSGFNLSNGLEVTWAP